MAVITVDSRYSKVDFAVTRALKRCFQVKGAEELGAAAVLMYSDPRDDGTVTTENGYLPSV
jgi:hypothetical protein